ncbi:hypothetical protein DSO57_1007301 [Entomophthora muscae]|uniref:Uncharacterized protein n=1 Tax=Entomophthora muscae TaxID=34485 RepID=A0ACC2RMA0_9FUNG|nr:hypothetical protein DSO57_1007301 [Entomophthora muscae]
MRINALTKKRVKRSSIKIKDHPIRQSPVIITHITGNLTYAVIKNAGHLTQVDQPETMLTLVDEWILQNKLLQ